MKGKRKKKLVLLGSGPGGLANALDSIDEKNITFFGFRVTGVDEKGGATRFDFPELYKSAPASPLVLYSADDPLPNTNTHT